MKTNKESKSESRQFGYLASSKHVEKSVDSRIELGIQKDSYLSGG